MGYCPDWDLNPGIRRSPFRLQRNRFFSQTFSF